MTARSGHLIEVNAMRAFAVLAVVLYHAYPSFVPGGFIGVDIFFVISGFVITRGYLARLESGEVGFADFYKKRVRRLLPASALVLLLTSIAAALILVPEDLIAYGWSVAAQPLFLQNFVFWAEGDYFSGPLAKPLLHTWSLGVEEQFYLFWPLLILLFRRTRKWMLVIALLSILSLAAGLLIEVRSPKTVFYLLPFRAWQFGLGMMAFFLVERVSSVSVGWKNAALVLFAGLGTVSCLMGGEWAAFPGPGNAAVALATALALLAIDKCNSPVHPVFAKGAVPYLGETSYSFYLWHWPPLSLFYLATGREAGFVEASLLMLLAFAGACASFHLVEDPIRRGRRIAPPRLVTSWLATSATIALIGGALVWSQGLLVRYPQEARPYLTAAMDSDKSRCSYIQILRNPSAETCALHEAGSDRPTVLFTGDSHVAVIKRMLADLGKEADVTVLLAVRNCDAGRYGTLAFCSDAVLDKLVAEARTKEVDAIIAMSYWELDKFDAESLAQDLQRLSAITPDIALVETVPFAPDYDPKKRVARFEAGGALVASGISRAEFGRVIAPVAQTLEQGRQFRGSQVQILRPQDYLCGPVECHYMKDGDVLYFDSNHLTLAGSELLRPMFRKEFDRLVAAHPPR